MELWEKNGGKVRESDLNGWAKQFHLLYQGRPAEWVTKAARLTLFQWQVAETDDRVKAGKEGRLKAETEGRLKIPILIPPSHLQAHLP